MPLALLVAFASLILLEAFVTNNLTKLCALSAISGDLSCLLACQTSNNKCFGAAQELLLDRVISHGQTLPWCVAQ
jgi:hypothetical protein